MADESSDFDTLPEDDFAVESEQAESEPEVDFDDLPDNIPVAVEHTSAVYENFKAQFGEDEAAMLQAKWGDRGLHNERVVRALVGSNPEADRIYAAHATDSGSLAAEGLDAGIEFLQKALGADSVETLAKRHPEIEALFYDHANERGDLSPAGIYRILAYVAKAKGLRFKYTGAKKR
jgi:hypothetical protein